MSLSYVSEKLSTAVNALATSAAPIQTRLEYAAMSCHTLANMHERSFPTDELRDRWVAWWASITSKPARDNQEGTIRATLSQMSDQEASDVAEELFNIYAGVERHSNRDEI